jgi:two-component system, cell cycle response regulator DivK
LNLILVEAVLEGSGYSVLTAADAGEALVLIHGAKPDLILMDLSLPGTDGLTLTRILKADAETRRIIVVALTAMAMKGDEQKALAAGCAAYITKPFDTCRLPLQLAELLARLQPA